MQSKTVNIVMAIYNPNLNYFEKQLRSLNNQTYKNITLTFVDDYSNFGQIIKKVIERNITNFSYNILVNIKNIGSNKTFEKLTSLCASDCIAYCDQDDIWHEDKIRLNVDELERSDSVLIYSDLEVIDESDITRFSSLRECRKRVVHKEGFGLWKYFVRMNSVTGCTMMVNANVARQAIPFPEKEYAWDQWVSILGAMAGRVAYIKIPLVKYRIHSNNQIGAKKLIGIRNREQYIEKRIMAEIAQCELLLSTIDDEEVRKTVEIMKKRVEKRAVCLKEPSLVNIIRNTDLLFRDFKLFLMETCIALDKRNEGRDIIEYVKKTRY